MPMIHKLKNSFFLGQYIIMQNLAQGAFGFVYSGYDLFDDNRAIIIKFTKNHAINEREFKTIQEI